MDLTTIKEVSELGAIGIALYLVWSHTKERKSTMEFIERQDERNNLVINNHLKEDLQAKYEVKKTLDENNQLIKKSSELIDKSCGVASETLNWLKNNK